MMKRIVLTVIILLIVAGLVACSNPMEAAVSQMAENSETSASAEDGSPDGDDTQMDMDMDIDEDGGSINISGDDGNISIEGSEDGMPWPGDKLPSGIPEVPGVTVVMVMDMDGGVLVGFENFDEATAQAYIAQLEGMGWESVMEFNDEDGYSNMFSNQDATLQLTWTSDDSAGTLTYIAE
jgi:hypothetical protein